MTVFKPNFNVYIPTDYEFNYKELKKLYKKYKKELREPREFKEVVETSFIYSFFKDNKFFLCIYYYEMDGKLFVNAFGKRHNHLNVMTCLKESLNWFNCDIYAYSILKTSILCLLRAGFKKIDSELYKYERDNK